MIPKIIHYCWFGRGELPELAVKCIESWKKFCPDYEIMVWNEENFDIDSNRYVKEAYEARKFAFVSDVARLTALYKHGGIYLDTDVMVLKSFDDYLHHKGFFGFESKKAVQTGVIAFEEGSEIVGELLKGYDNRTFVTENNTFDLTTNVAVITEAFEDKGLVLNGEYQEVCGVAFYPQNIFCPDLDRLTDNQYMKDAVTIHYFAGSWKSEATLRRERSLWWKAFAFLATIASKILTRLLGDKWTNAKNKVRDNVIENEKNK